MKRSLLADSFVEGKKTGLMEGKLEGLIEGKLEEIDL
jgi:hypothetical protein